MNPALVAALWMSGAIVSFTSMAVAGRAISLDLDTFEIMLYRSLLGIVIVLTVSSIVGTRRQITTRNMGLHLVRNISHFTGQNLWFFAVATIPLAQVFSLEFTSPLWVVVLSPLILGEALTRSRVFAALLGFIGILIVTRPGTSEISPGVIAAALAAIGFAGSAVFTRRLTRTETITCILFWLTTLQAVFGLVCAGYDGDIALPARSSVPLLGVIGCAGLIAHFCLTTALRIAPATVVMPIDFARLPVVAIIGALVYGEILDPFVFIGAAIIFVGNYVNILAESKNPATPRTVSEK
ncbi:Threonine/homoserine efflux transporter RhtA [Poseidonocella pacifica]|uniref:Threonine/homoserine efflux transporter RhtA n=1 Tax=Poseidonocella pacifica TaxID=871651 RepID=A0A1I0VLC0_9RHOB|nr:DMT family transporter [Poseidonocella pacifica]SFA77269.1 Threonine/homoserine efflux transporter RhtA [Poseidonocella pacifica]